MKNKSEKILLLFIAIISIVVVYILLSPEQNQPTQNPAQVEIEKKSISHSQNISDSNTANDTSQESHADSENTTEEYSEGDEIKFSDEQYSENNEIKDLTEDLQNLKKCSKNPDSCNLPQTDPRSAELELSRRIASKIDEITSISQSNSQDSSQSNSQYDEIAQEYILYHDGHVQESALKLMATLEPNKKSAEILITGLKSTHDAKIFRMSLIEFSRHSDPSIKANIDSLLIDTLKTGGHFASQEIAKGILPILSNDNISEYKSVLDELPANSAKAKLLKANIEEFELQQSGG